MLPIRSALFVPGNREDRIAKAVLSASDVVIIDLEDAVPPTAKVAARNTAASAVLQYANRRIWVRCNAPGSSMQSDLQAFVHGLPECFMVPKVHSAASIQQANALCAALEEKAGVPPGTVGLVALIESAEGVVALTEIAMAGKQIPRLRLLALGAADLSLDAGLVPDGKGSELAYPRSLMPLVSRAGGLEPPLDTPYMADLSSSEKFEADARLAKCTGFQGKLLVHPRQVEPCNALFSPTEEEISRARMITEAFAQADAQAGALQVDGLFIDPPVAARAARVLRMAGEIVD